MTHSSRRTTNSFVVAAERCGDAPAGLTTREMVDAAAVLGGWGARGLGSPIPGWEDGIRTGPGQMERGEEGPARWDLGVFQLKVKKFSKKFLAEFLADELGGWLKEMDLPIEILLVNPSLLQIQLPYSKGRRQSVCIRAGGSSPDQTGRRRSCPARWR
jgi:hypothetical protein